MTHTELFGSAHWVAPSAPCSQPYLRSAFTASGVEDASITISGLGFFELYCNGKRVSPDLLVPAWTDYEPHVFAHCIGGNPVRETRGHRILAMRYFCARGKTSWESASAPVGMSISAMDPLRPVSA